MTLPDDPPPIPTDHAAAATRAREGAETAGSRTAEAMAAWRRRSRNVHFFRRALPISIGVVAVILLGWVLTSAFIARVDDLKAADSVKLVNPRFYGQDSSGRAFVVGAREAVRVRANEVRLDKPLVSLSNDDGAATRLTAERGLYGEKERVVRLNRNVVVTDPGSGFTFRTGEAVIDTRTGRVTGEKSITGQGPLGQMSASSYAIEGQGQRVILKGGVRARLEQDRK